MSISRRLVLAGIATAPLSAALPAAAPLSRRELRVVTADDVHIGVHELTSFGTYDRAYLG